MKKLPHPGFAVRRKIEPSGLTIQDAADHLHVSREALSEVVNGRRGISPEMAVRLEKVFGLSAEELLIKQAKYELSQVRTGPLRKLKRFDFH